MKSTLLLILLTSILWTASLLESQNTLIYSQWISSKRMLSEYVMGARETTVTRATLAGHKLRLGSYYGYQQIISKSSFEPSRTIIDFDLPANSFLDFIFNGQNENFTALRLSADPRYPSQLYKSNSDGKHIATKPLEKKTISPGNHSLECEMVNGQLSIKIDNILIFQTEEFKMTNGFIGFQSGFHGADIKHVQVYSKNGKWEDAFYNTKNLTRYFFFSIALLLACFIIIAAICLSLKIQELKAKLNLFARTLFIFSLLWFCFDFFYYQRIPTSWKTPDTPEAIKPVFKNFNFEGLRFHFFEKLKTLAGEKLTHNEAERENSYPPYDFRTLAHCLAAENSCKKANYQSFDLTTPRHPGTYRILFLGSSFSSGRGARSFDKTLYVRTDHFLREHLKPYLLDTLNYAVSGDPSDAAREYLNALYKFKPDLVIVIFTTAYSEKFRQFIQRIMKNGSKVLIAIGPDNSDMPKEKRYKGNDNWLPKWPPEMQSKAINDQVHLVDFTHITNSLEVMQSGVIWLDEYHMTGYGQALISQLLSAEALKILKNQKPLH